MEQRVLVRTLQVRGILFVRRRGDRDGFSFHVSQDTAAGTEPREKAFNPRDNTQRVRQVPELLCISKCFKRSGQARQRKWLSRMPHLYCGGPNRIDPSTRCADSDPELGGNARFTLPNNFALFGQPSCFVQQWYLTSSASGCWRLQQLCTVDRQTTVTVLISLRRLHANYAIAETTEFAWCIPYVPCMRLSLSYLIGSMLHLYRTGLRVQLWLEYETIHYKLLQQTALIHARDENHIHDWQKRNMYFKCNTA